MSSHAPPSVTQVMLLMAHAPSARMLTCMVASYTFNVKQCNKEGGLPAVLMALSYMLHRLSASKVSELTLLNIGNRGPARPLLEALFSFGPSTFLCGGKLVLQGLYVDAETVLYLFNVVIPNSKLYLCHWSCALSTAALKTWRAASPGTMSMGTIMRIRVIGSCLPCMYILTTAYGQPGVILRPISISVEGRALNHWW